MSASDDLDYGWIDIIPHEEMWRNGYHETREGEELLLSEMTESHLRNTIKYFCHLDVEPLEEELRRRQYENRN